MTAAVNPLHRLIPLLPPHGEPFTVQQFESTARSAGLVIASSADAPGIRVTSALRALRKWGWAISCPGGDQYRLTAGAPHPEHGTGVPA